MHAAVPHSTAADDRTREARRAVMAVLAEARADELAGGLGKIENKPEFALLRPVETGLVMVRGRIGGDGAAFNLGEATVTRAAVQLASGEVGFSYSLGRDVEKTRLAAYCDALWQTDSFRSAIETSVVEPVRKRTESARAEQRARTAATRVDFFTIVRGED